ncbi:hypothetical protein DPMN_188033 [Dreissena polymorpha]|uniref:Uncharacterized protein n=1 Tax=Dreissena polymorpha TaxID=45954 RepID=A0A9D4DSP1_DREPO|nr:hypothetical protein DPMN_188033 [Dreissena polymorpha]
MFAKPASKKMSTPVNKQKVSAKPKAVSVKSGVKTTQHGKRSKSDSTKNGKAFKPAQRPDAGYSLYSTDSEDQVTLAFNEMETCEKILTHLKSKQKEPSTKSKGKSKVKRNETTSPPRPLNENPPVSTIVPGWLHPLPTLKNLQQTHRPVSYRTLQSPTYSRTFLNVISPQSPLCHRA